jgi:GNAT superfamily N-acetyltransferase
MRRSTGLCAGVYLGGDQVGFARVITDRASFGYLGHVYILEPHRGRGLSKELVVTLLAHPDRQGLRRGREAMRCHVLEVRDREARIET